MTNRDNNYNILIEKARKNFEEKNYLEAINHLDKILENHNNNGYAFFLRGKTYSDLKKYKSALVDLEKALDIYKETDDKRF